MEEEAPAAAADPADPAAAVAALCDAATAGDVPLCKELLAAGTAVEPVGDGVSETPLMWAAVGGDVATARCLVAAGACPRRADRFGYSAPFHAVHHGREAMLRYLCSAEGGADPSQRDGEGHDLVHWAAFTGDVPMLRYLIDELRLPTATLDSAGRSALHWAARQGHGGGAALLLQVAPDLAAAPDHSGMTPRDHAAERFHVHVTSLFDDALSADSGRRGSGGSGRRSAVSLRPPSRLGWADRAADPSRLL